MFYEVTGDLFNIAERLKKLNKNYCVFWNNKDFRYEVHSGNPPAVQNLCFIIPYNRLDQRALEYARRTRKENADILEQEIDTCNAAIADNVFKSVKHAETALVDMLEYARGASHPVNFIRQNKWF